MALYIVFLYGGNALLSLIAGLIIQGSGWRWFCWLCAIIAGLNFLCIALLVPETRYKRSVSIGESTAGADDHKVPAATSEAVEKVATESRVELIGTKKSFFQDLSLWSGTGQESFLSHFMRPWLLCAYPAVTWATVACESRSQSMRSMANMHLQMV
jgi:MFS family permease